MTKKKTDSNKPPLRLKSRTKLFFQGHFLHYINECAPELSFELKKLTQTCEELFGKFPVSIHALPDQNNFGVWFLKDDEQRRAWSFISRTFMECVYKKFRNNHGSSSWISYFADEDGSLKKALDTQQKYTEIIDELVEKQIENNLDDLKLEFSALTGGEILPQEVEDYTIRVWLKRPLYEFLRENDEIYRNAEEFKNSKINKLEEFQKSFDSLLENYCLEKFWLAKSVFGAIWNGLGKLQMESVYMEEIPKEVALEIQDKLKIPRQILRVPYGDDVEIPQFGENSIPNTKPFTYKEPYSIYSSFKNYEQKAVEAYRQHINDYLIAIKDSFKKHGYAEHRGDAFDYDQVQRLVYWNISNFVYLWEIVESIPEFHEVNIKNESEVNSATNRLISTFELCKKFDLPVRPYGRQVRLIRPQK